MSFTKKDIVEALKNIRYPGTGKDIVSSGILQDDIAIDGQKVSFTLFFEKTNDPFAKSVMKASEQALLTFISDSIEIKDNITIKFKENPTPEKTESLLPDVKNIICVFSGKGGVGKSTVSSNLSVALASLGYKVGLLDADIHGPSIPKMFGVEDEKVMVDEIDGKQRMLPIEKYGIRLLSIGFFIDPNNALVWRGTLAGNALKQLITDTKWGDLDFFIIDMPPGTGDIQLTLVQTLNITGSIIVTTPQEVALADARKGINMFQNEKVNIPILGVVENMAWFTPEELPNNKYYIFGKDGGKNLAKEFSLSLLAQIPINQYICEKGDFGEPVSVTKENSSAIIFNKLAQKLINKLQ